MADPLDILTGRAAPREDDWQATLANIAQVVASIPERRQRAEQQRAEMEQQAENSQVRRGYLNLQQQELAAKQEAAKTAQLVNGIASKYIKPSSDGSYKTVDRGGLAQALSAAGAPPETALHYTKLLDEIDQSSKRAADAKDQDKADLAHSILKANQKPDTAEVAFALALAKSNHSDITDEQLAPFYEAMATGKDLRPLLMQIRSQFDRAGKYKEAGKPTKLGPGDVLVPEEGGEPIAKNPKEVTPESKQSKSVLLNGKPTEVVFEPRSGKFFDASGNDVSANVKPMPPASVVYPQSKPDMLVKMEHKDPTTGKTVIEWLPRSQLAGIKFEKGTSATIENRLASSEAVNQTGQDIIAQLSDPKVASQVGPAMGRFNTLRDFLGNPPPELSELAGSIESYALANMGVHGMRSVQGAAEVKKLLDAKHTPESLIKTIQGLNKFSQHFMENQGRQAPATKPHAGESLTIAQIDAVAKKRGQTYAEAKVDAEALGYVVK